MGSVLNLSDENFEHKRMDFARRNFGRAVYLETISRQRAGKIFGENTAARVASTEKKNAEFLAHKGEVSNRYSQLRWPLFQSCDKIVTILPLAFPNEWVD
jgi:hypothetical protein